MDFTISDNAVNLITQFEGFQANAYPDPGTGSIPFTIGYGTTVYSTGVPVQLGDTITEDQARAEILYHLNNNVLPTLCSKITTGATQNQVDACASLIYNIGSQNFSNSSVLRYLNANEPKQAQNSFLLWNKAAGKVMRGLTRRRLAEATLFGPQSRDDLITGLLDGFDPDQG